MLFRKNTLHILVIALLLLFVASVITGCGGTSKDTSSRESSEQPNTEVKDKKVVIGAKGFTGNMVVAEILAQLVEAKTDIKVDRQFELATALIQPAILKGEVDLYPEYTGTALLVQLKEDPITDRHLVYEKVKEEYAKRYNITWTEPLGFSDGYGLAVRKETAQQLGIRTYSDLAKHSEQMVFGAEYDFYERPEGYDKLVEAYGFKFKDKKEMDGALKYQAIGQGKIDAVVVYETDGPLAVYDLQVLEDDKSFFIPYDCAFIVRDEIKEKYPELMEVIGSLAGKITNADAQALNKAIDNDKKAINVVAREFIEAKGLLN